jgi:hypothetical protein
LLAIFDKEIIGGFAKLNATLKPRVGLDIELGLLKTVKKEMNTMHSNVRWRNGASLILPRS